MDSQPPSSSNSNDTDRPAPARGIPRAWFLLLAIVILSALGGLVAIGMLNSTIEAETATTPAFEAHDVFMQPEATWNTSIFSAHSPEAREIRRLAWLVIGIAIAIFVVVETLLIFAIIRYRKRESDTEGEPTQLYGSNPVELAWTLIPVLIVLALCLATVRTIHDVQPLSSDRPDNAVTVEVIGHRWWWEFRYPEYGIVTANELYAPLGRPIWLELGSADVVHSFWVPELQGKMDAFPAHTNYWVMTPDHTGVYLGQCAEFCGTQHANMLIRVEVTSQESFDQWVAAQQLTPTSDIADPLVATGRGLFVEYACRSCHAIRGVADGDYAPDLTHLMSRQTIAGGMLPNTEANLKAWIDNPNAIKPGCDMPALQLDSEQIEALVAYLVTLK